MHAMGEEGVDDMATLTELHGGAIMHNLYQRYKRNQIYVSSALSPLKILPVFSFLLGALGISTVCRAQRQLPLPPGVPTVPRTNREDLVFLVGPGMVSSDR